MAPIPVGTGSPTGGMWTHFMRIKGPSGFSSTSTADEVAAEWQGSGKVAVVTGCTVGLGLYSVKVLVSRGCEVVAAVRDTAKMEAALEPVRKAYPAAKITVMQLDLASLASVRSFAAAFKASGKAINILMLNAGVMAGPFRLSADGHEMQFATNHLGHFLLTELLLPVVSSTAARPGAPEGRIVVLSSLAHTFADPKDVDNIERINSKSNYKPWVQYGTSKLCNILFARELSRRVAGQRIAVGSLHPGCIPDTDLGRSFVPPMLKRFGILLLSPLSKTVPQGAATQVYLAVAPSIASGAYYFDVNLAPSTAAAQDDALALRLWQLSEKLCAQQQASKA